MTSEDPAPLLPRRRAGAGRRVAPKSSGAGDARDRPAPAKAGPLARLRLAGRPAGDGEVAMAREFHDAAFKRWFDHARMVEDLLRGFAPADVVATMRRARK